MHTNLKQSKKGTGHRILRWWIFGLTIIVGFQMVACSPQAASPAKPKPAVVETVNASKLKRVLLTESAANRIGIQTMEIKKEQEIPIPKTGEQTKEANQSGSNAEQNPQSVQVIPYAAIIYDTDGKTWVYTNPEPLTFIRHEVIVDRIEGDKALLTEQIPVGTNVVTVGVIELYGAETGVGK